MSPGKKDTEGSRGGESRSVTLFDLLARKNLSKNIEKTLDKMKRLWYTIQVAGSDAGMAQSVEHVIGNDEVISSNLITSSKSGPHCGTE